jgi:hypothetical protein
MQNRPIHAATGRPKEGRLCVAYHVALWILSRCWLRYGKDPTAAEIREIWKCVLREISKDVDWVDLCESDPKVAAPSDLFDADLYEKQLTGHEGLFAEAQCICETLLSKMMQNGKKWISIEQSWWCSP